MLLANAVHQEVLSSPISSAAQTTWEPNNFVFQKSEFESEARPRHLIITLQNVQLHKCATVCTLSKFFLSTVLHFLWVLESRSGCTTKNARNGKSLSIGFYCNNYLHYCFLACRSIIQQKIAVKILPSSYLLWLGIIFKIKRPEFVRFSLLVFFKKVTEIGVQNLWPVRGSDRTSESGVEFHIPKLAVLVQ